MAAAAAVAIRGATTINVAAVGSTTNTAAATKGEALRAAEAAGFRADSSTRVAQLVARLLRAQPYQPALRGPGQVSASPAGLTDPTSPHHGRIQTISRNQQQVAVVAAASARCPDHRCRPNRQHQFPCRTRAAAAEGPSFPLGTISPGTMLRRARLQTTSSRQVATGHQAHMWAWTTRILTSPKSAAAIATLSRTKTAATLKERARLQPTARPTVSSAQRHVDPAPPRRHMPILTATAAMPNGQMATLHCPFGPASGRITHRPDHGMG